MARSGNQRRALWSWLTLAVLAGLLGMLAILQYRWIGEVSEAENVTRRDNLKTGLSQIRGEFDTRLNRAIAGLAGNDVGPVNPATYAQRYQEWKTTDAADAKLFRRVAFVDWQKQQPILQVLNSQTGNFAPVSWPSEWNDLKERVTTRSGEPGRGGFFSPPSSAASTSSTAVRGDTANRSRRFQNDSNIIVIPRFSRGQTSSPRGETFAFRRGEIARRQPEEARFANHRQTSEPRAEAPPTQSADGNTAEPAAEQISSPRAPSSVSQSSTVSPIDGPRPHHRRGFGASRFSDPQEGQETGNERRREPRGEPFGPRRRDGGERPRDLAFEREWFAQPDWLILEVDPSYAATVVLPELLARYLGSDYAAQYDVSVAFRNNPAKSVFHAGTAAPQKTLATADASITLFDPLTLRGETPLTAPPFTAPSGSAASLTAARETGTHQVADSPQANSSADAPARPFGGLGNLSRGRWQLSVWSKGGSLEGVVEQTRLRNLAVSAGIFILLLMTSAVLVRLSRQTQHLAETEMEFVAGVSHELRTPLTVIRTAAFNLRGRLSNNPAQVEQYGALIQHESEKLTAIVEQVLRFSSARTGYVIRERQPIAVNQLIDESLQSASDAIEGLNDGLEHGRVAVQKRIDPGLPMVMGDALALRHALQNLIGNAAKYGLEGGNWIGLFAQAVPAGKSTSIQIRVEDHGPGISVDEQPHIFDAFFRGKKAVMDQIHGTGLGLNLVKKIIEAHGGTVAVESELGAGASFVITLPAAPLGLQA